MKHTLTLHQKLHRMLKVMEVHHRTMIEAIEALRDDLGIGDMAVLPSGKPAAAKRAEKCIAPAGTPHVGKTLAEVEREMIVAALDKHKGKRSLVATELGMCERTLYRRLKVYGLTRD